MRTLDVTPEQLRFVHAAQLIELQRASLNKSTRATSAGRRVFVASEPLSPADAQRPARARRGIENKNHRPRDATWLEDKTRARAGHPPASHTLMRGLVLRWWRRRHPASCAPACLLRNQRRLPAALREIIHPLQPQQ